MITKQNICSICDNIYIGWGNNAQPINSGRCCDDCNFNKVIFTRINIMSNGLIKNDKKEVENNLKKSQNCDIDGE